MIFKTVFLLNLLVSVSVLAETDEIHKPHSDPENTQVVDLPANENDGANNSNVTITNNESDESNKTQKFVQCTLGMGTDAVQLTNDTELIRILQPDTKITDRDALAPCVLVLFYSKHCPFSSLAAPHFNALPRAFPDIRMVAINAMMYHLFNTQNGIVGVPSLMLFHNGKSVAKFNGSEYSLDKFSQFITKHTGVPAVAKSFVTSADFAGPVISVPSKDSDFFLILSWIFIVICCGYYFTKSRCCTWIIETVQSNWRESEAQAQHEHME